jgi:glycosyltransferase involved in cell wall biosynthesis
MKIGLTTSGFEGWSGGIDFFCNLSTALYLSAQKDIQTEIFASRFGLHYLAKKFALPAFIALKNIATKASLRYSQSTLVDPRLIHKQLAHYQDHFPVHSVSSSWSSHQRSAFKRNVGILMPCFAPPSSDFPLPWVGYLADCQHKYLPQYFSKKEAFKRDNLFQEMLRKATHVMVNSLSAKEDFEKFYPDCQAKIYALPFSPILNNDHLHSCYDARDLFGIAKPYFLVSNQFWIHKNHSLLFRAFSRFNHSNKGQFNLVCTGATVDARFPNYFSELQASLADLGISNSVLILGRIPRRDQLALMRKCIAVIQPTLFEGGPGGGASYDAVSMGIPLILSDIPINREVVSTSYTDYFDPTSDDDLFSSLTRACSVPRNTFSSLDLLKLSHARAVKLGSFLVDIAKDAMSYSSGGYPY